MSRGFLTTRVVVPLECSRLSLTLVRRLCCRYNQHALEITRAIREAKDSAVGDVAVDDGLSNVNDAVTGLIDLLANLNECYESGDDLRLPQLISTLAPKLDAIASSQDSLGSLAASKALEPHVLSMVETCEGLKSQLERLAQRAQAISDRRIQSELLMEDTRRRMERARAVKADDAKAAAGKANAVQQELDESAYVDVPFSSFTL